MPLQETKILNEAERILDERVRPYLRSHGGNIFLKEIRDGVLYMTLTGSCSNCSASWLTVEDLVKPVLTEEIPELKDVSLDQTVDSETLQLIRDVLEGRQVFGETLKSNAGKTGV